jgi:hypothetical protein
MAQTGARIDLETESKGEFSSPEVGSGVRVPFA